MRGVDATVGIPPAVTEETEAVLGRGRRGPAARRALHGVRRRLVPAAGHLPHVPLAATPTLVEITGRGRVYSFTVNHQRWLPDLEVPYAIVLVEFPDHPGVRVVGRLRGCAPEDVAIGMEVDVGFEPGPGGFADPELRRRRRGRR